MMKWSWSTDLSFVAKQAQISPGTILGDVHHGGEGTFANGHTWVSSRWPLSASIRADFHRINICIQIMTFTCETRLLSKNMFVKCCFSFQVEDVDVF